jgi:hypothetical protein|tara:strand:- start:879 stop:1103 length:225 start_codon:yes stop_codon:yes gene_type:complete
MTNKCERPPTNGEIVYKIFHEWLGFWLKFINLVFKSKLLSLLFVTFLSCGLMFFLAGLSLDDCIKGAKFIISIL